MEKDILLQFWKILRLFHTYIKNKNHIDNMAREGA